MDYSTAVFSANVLRVELNSDHIDPVPVPEDGKNTWAVQNHDGTRYNTTEEFPQVWRDILAEYRDNR
jgi:hypothetical protein